MPKANRIDDALTINDENDRILEFWLYARASSEFCEEQDPSDFLFVTNLGGQEDRKTLASSLDSVERTPESLEACFLRRKITLSLPFVEQFVNEANTVALYVRPPQEQPEGSTSIPPKTTKLVGKKDRNKRDEDVVSLEKAEKILFLSFDLVDLLTMPSMRLPVSLAPDAMLQDCAIEIRCGTAFLPPTKLNRYRPLKIEVHSICNLPKPSVRDEPVFLSVKFGDIQFRSPKLDVAPNGKVLYRRVLFLGTQTPLSLYQKAFFHKIEVSAFYGAKTCVGIGTLSLRAAVTDRQTEFSETVHLLPNRTTPALDDNCLTKGAIVSLRFDLFTPLPYPSHVDSDGQPAHGRFLTRGLIRMPYAAKWTSNVLEALITTLLQFKKAHEKSDVYQYKLPQPEPEAPPPKDKKKDRGKPHKGQVLPPPRPPSPISLFDAPFKIVTPPGISGFEVMDDNMRIICVEGPAAEVHKILERASAAAGHDPKLVLLMNAELFVPRRSYVVFPPLVTVPQIVNDTTTGDEARTILPKEGTVAPSGLGGRVTERDSTVAGTVELLSSPTSTAECNREAGEIFDSAEAEAGGTGGRIHRIRIKETIESLVSQQHYLLKRVLSESCVKCYTKLDALCGCLSLWNALERDLFPTPEELIALERSFGATLELPDVFGRQEFVNVAVAKQSPDFSYKEVEEESVPGVDVGALHWSDVGKMVLFEATRIMSSQKRIPAHVQQRYPQACWMRTLDTNSDVLCAFPPGSQPGGTIRYLVEAQVVRCEQTLCLYALECSSLAKSHTHTRNPAYEASLAALRKQRTRDLLRHKPKQKQKQGKSPAATFSTVQLGSALAVQSDDSEDDQLVDSPPREARVAPKTITSAFERDFVARNRRNIASLTKYVPRMTTADYDFCWELYKRRVPVAPPQRPRGPPMHF
ncbi:hypothetical protein DQ04_00061360 [Trypanosoma grayi]|uniref:hypothetical protein n=1 Tax=Trypanosoma grayi TaxID=71804 RepID=UPI0004F41E05|nr:hypothetical protein DQ04_00061360 [Trypanosoma grayi]KEG15498.1 hypothetical protein DQ04_00061360 [Trypanosoma grayi]